MGGVSWLMTNQQAGFPEPAAGSGEGAELRQLRSSTGNINQASQQETNDGVRISLSLIVFWCEHTETN